LIVEFEYIDSNNNSYGSTETLGLAVEREPEDVSSGTPRVLINRYTLSEENIYGGDNVTLSLSIMNTHLRPVSNIKVSLVVSQVEGGSGGSGTVFSPINSSNSFFISQIPGQTAREHRIDLFVDPNAEAKTYIVPVVIEYEDEFGESYVVNEMVNIPVTQESKLQILDIEIPRQAFVGQPLFISAEFVNVGKVNLGNFIVMMEGDFHKEQSTYYVGNLQIGASDYYQGMIFPDREGVLPFWWWVF